MFQQISVIGGRNSVLTLQPVMKFIHRECSQNYLHECKVFPNDTRVCKIVFTSISLAELSKKNCLKMLNYRYCKISELIFARRRKLNKNVKYCCKWIKKLIQSKLMLVRPVVIEPYCNFAMFSHYFEKNN